MDQEEIYKGWLHKSRVTRGARARAHALKAIDILIRQQNSGRFDKEEHRRSTCNRTKQNGLNKRPH